MWDETKFCVYGTPLPAIEKDAVPSKRPARPEDQIVTDENGRRRFHGAFTGGFSAGYWNTVGSQEGWTPQMFKSSRAEKAPQRQQQRPEDFMDAEDMGEFGIAPKKVQVRPEFANEAASAASSEGNERKRKFLLNPSVGAIPGAPVLCQLLKKPEVENVAVRILKHWGWRPGRGVGPRQTRLEKKQAKERNKREMYILERYGCDASTQERKPIGYDDSEEEEEAGSANDDEDDADDGITYAPEDFEPLPAVNENRYGVGYTPLSRESVLSQDLTAKPRSQPQVFELLNKNNTKFSITGQAFGVGALEDDDDMEIYQRDDLSKYDFSLEDERKKRKEKQQKLARDTTVLEGFAAAKENYIYKPAVYKVDMSIDFRPRNWGERRSRFTPLDPKLARDLESNLKSCSLRKDTNLTPELRGKLLGEEGAAVATTSATAVQEDAAAAVKSQSRQEYAQQRQRERDEKTKALLERITAKSANFTRGGIITADGEEKRVEGAPPAMDEQLQAVLTKAQSKTKHLPSAPISGTFKPFLGDDAKQQRYDEFLAAELKGEEEISAFLRNIQPVHLSDWDREMEKKEFIQARSIYKPLGGLMSDRFVTETAVEAEKVVVVVAAKEAGANTIIMQRTAHMWKPSALLCKRYNIAEPFGGAMLEQKKPARSKLSVFDYLETSVNKKADFQTPVIIPKHIERPLPIVREPQWSVPALVEPPSTPAAEREDAAAPVIAEPTTSTAAAAVEAKTKAVQPKGFVARTELQKRVVETLDQPASEKFELFKAIFDNDSDAEESEAPKEDPATAAAESAKAAFVANLLQPKSAAAANLLRNTSPPRGIFAALFKAAEPPKVVPAPPPPPAESVEKIVTAPTTVPDAPPKIAYKPRSERFSKAPAEETPVEEPPTDDIAYGPKLPERLQPVSAVETQILQLLDKHRHGGAAEPQWVERGVPQSGDTDSDSLDSESDSSSDDSKKAHKKKTKKAKKQKSRERAKKRNKKKDKKSSKGKKSHKIKKSKKASK